MMRVVVDTNRLETDELRLFLASCRNNMAVLPEHTIVEVFKVGELSAIRSSFSVLCDFPEQVLILYGNRKSAKVNARAPAISNHFIDRKNTRAFPEFCKMLRAAKEDDAKLRHQLAQRERWSNERVDEIQDALGDQAETLAELHALFTPAERAKLRSENVIPRKALGTILSITKHIAIQLNAGISGKHFLPPPPYMFYSFPWRYALCHVIQLMELFRNGAVRRSPAKARNDHFDNVFAIYGTYFNGVMTNDRGTLVTQTGARAILKFLGARLATDYVRVEYLRSLLDNAEQVSSPQAD